jgi:trigger factor
MAKTSSVEKLAGLKRRVGVVVDAEKVSSAYGDRLKQASKQAKLDGFRPGKIPQKVLEQRLGKNILFEVAEELMRQHFVTAIEEHDLRIAGTPVLVPGKIEHNAELAYHVEFEVYPEIELKDLSGVTIARERVEISDHDIDTMVDNLRKQQASWEKVDRAAQNGDQVSIDFVGKLNGEAFQGGSANGFSLELGAKQMIPGFEDAILGKKAGDEFVIECRFPENYGQKDLAGKLAHFDTKLTEVREAKLPDINDEFASKLNVEGGVTGLRNEIRQSMQHQVSELMADRFKKQVFDRLLELHPLELPESLVEAEVSHMQEMALNRFGDKAKNMDKETLFPRTQFIEQAQKRVRLGLILAEIIRKLELKVDEEKVTAKIRAMGEMYGQAEQFEAWYRSNERMMSEVQAMVLEMQAVDKLAEQMQIEDRLVSYEAATKAAQASE